MNRLITLALFSAIAAMSAEVRVSGTISADVASYLDTSWKPHNSANQDIRLTTTAEFDQKARIELHVKSVSTFERDSSSGPMESVVRNREYAARIEDPAAHWSTLTFYGVQFQWEFSRQAFLVLGDMNYSLGQPGHYAYTHNAFATVMPGTNLRGLGFHLGSEGQVYLGAPDLDQNALWGYASYRFSMKERTDEKIALRVAGDLIFKNGGRNHRHTLGSEFEYSRSKGSLNYGLFAAAGLIPFRGENTYTLLLEPSMNWKDFSLGISAYQAFLADKDSALTAQTQMPVQRYLTIEPGVSFNPKVALGIAGEFHDQNIEFRGNEYFACTPNLYLYPTPELAFTLWSSYRWNMKAGDTFAFGISGKAEF